MEKGAVRSPKERHLHGHFLLTFLCTQYTTNILRKSDYCDYYVLLILHATYYSKSGLRYSDLLKRLAIADTSLVNRLRKLEEAKYITRELWTDANDKKSVRYVLTKSGRKLAEAFDTSLLLQKIDTAYAKINKGCS